MLWHFVKLSFFMELGYQFRLHTRQVFGYVGSYTDLYIESIWCILAHV